MALYLGKDKIASNGTITGDTLPIGAVVEYDGTEVPANWELFEGNEDGAGIPEIAQETIYLTDLADGLYKCTYEIMWASPAEEEANEYGYMVLGEQECYLYKYTSYIGGILTGAYCQPFSVRLITADGDKIIHVDSSGMGTTHQMYPSQIETLQEKVTVLETNSGTLANDVTVLEEKMSLVNKIDLIVLNAGGYNYKNTYSISPLMTWQDIIDDVDFINFQNEFSSDSSSRVYFSNFRLMIDTQYQVPVYTYDRVVPGRAYYVHFTASND